MRSTDGAIEPAGQLLAALDALAAEDVPGLPDETLRAQLPALLTAVNRLHGEIVRRITSFDTRDLAQRDGCRTAKTWLQAFGRLSGAGAASLVKTGRLLRQLPEAAAAVAAGDVSAEHLNRLTRLTDRVGITRVTDLDPTLASAAAQLDPTGFGRVCDRVRAHLDPDGPQPDPHEDFQRRGITLSPFDGMVLVRGQLDPEGGAALRTAIDALTGPPAPGDARTPAQRRADALVELTRRALAAGDLPTTGGARPQLAILVTPDALTTTPSPGGPPPGSPAGDPTAPARTPEPPWLEWFGDISPTTARRLACDADAWRVVLDPANGQPLDVGRRHRLVPHWIRKALWARDRQCRFPGCRTPAAWTDAHHLTAWQDGGETKTANLVLLCRYHHVLIHEGGWSVRFDHRDGTLRAIRPDGRPYEIPPSPSWTATADRWTEAATTTDPPPQAA
jgi:hypothetical protein